MVRYSYAHLSCARACVIWCATENMLLCIFLVCVSLVRMLHLMAKFYPKAPTRIINVAEACVFKSWLETSHGFKQDIVKYCVRKSAWPSALQTKKNPQCLLSKSLKKKKKNPVCLLLHTRDIGMFVKKAHSMFFASIHTNNIRGNKRDE